MKNIVEISEKQAKKIILEYFVDLIDQNLFLDWCKNKNITCKFGKVSVANCLVREIFNVFLLDVEFIAKKDPSVKSIEELINSKTKALIATFLYRIANFFYYTELSLDMKQMRCKCKELMQESLAQTSIDIHPGAKIGKCFFIDHGANTVIGETCEIGDYCNLFNNVILGSKNVINVKPVKRHPTLKNNVTICAGAKILGDITLGNNVFISPGAVVLEDIEDDQKVIITNQLQVTKNTTYSYLPSQKLVIYGVVPKFKNTIIIMGESFYNPTVLIKLKNEKKLDYSITYWDKNKIIIKIKNTTPFDKEAIAGAKVIVLSNSNKIVLINSIGLERALTTLSD